MTLATEPNAITAHELLLLMAGRVSDAPLAQARSLLAGGSAKQAVSLLADVLAAAPIALEPAELAAVMDLSGAAVPLPDLGTVDEQSPAPFGFSPFDEFGEVARDDLDAAVIAAVQQQSEGVTGLWRSWRYLIAEVQVGNSGGWPSAVPASAAGFASPFRVYLVHVDDPEKANDLARAVLDAAGDPRRTGVEIVGLAKEPPLYQEAALAQSRLLWASAANPEFTVARVYDFAELASGPGFHADHPIVDDPAERKLISAYLHAGRAVLMTTATSDDIVDPGAGAALIRLNGIPDDSARCRVATRVATRPYDRAAMGRLVARDLRNAVEFGRDGANLDPHFAVDDAVLLTPIERRAGQTFRDIFDATEEGPHLVDRISDDEALPELDLRLPIRLDPRSHARCNSSWSRANARGSRRRGGGRARFVRAP